MTAASLAAANAARQRLSVPCGRGRLRRSGPPRPGTDRPTGHGKADQGLGLAPPAQQSRRRHRNGLCEFVCVIGSGANLPVMTQQRGDWAAELARQYIEATLNVPVETWDRGGRQGAHDLRYDHEGRSTAVEVKRIVDSDYRAMEDRIAKTGYVRDNRLTRT